MYVRNIILRKRAIRIISGSAPLAHTDPLFVKARQLKVQDYYTQVAISQFYVSVLARSVLPMFLNVVSPKIVLLYLTAVKPHSDFKI